MDHIKKVSLELKNKLNDVTFEQLSDFLNKDGWKVILYNPNKGHSLFESLHLKNYSEDIKSFTYFKEGKRSIKIVFINKSESEKAQTYWLAHETGHIFLGHVYLAAASEISERQEVDANLFASYLLDKRPVRISATRLLSVSAYFALAAAVTGLSWLVYSIYINQQDTITTLNSSQAVTSLADEQPSTIDSSFVISDTADHSSEINSPSSQSVVSSSYPVTSTKSHISSNAPSQVESPASSESAPVIIIESESEPEIPIININTAAAEEIESLPMIGHTLSLKIVRYRDKNGPFNSVEDLINVDGIGEDLLNEIRPYVTVD